MDDLYSQLSAREKDLANDPEALSWFDFPKAPDIPHISPNVPAESTNAPDIRHNYPNVPAGSTNTPESSHISLDVPVGSTITPLLGASSACQFANPKDLHDSTGDSEDDLQRRKRDGLTQENLSPVLFVDPKDLHGPSHFSADGLQLGKDDVVPMATSRSRRSSLSSSSSSSISGGQGGDEQSDKLLMEGSDQPVGMESNLMSRSRSSSSSFSSSSSSSSSSSPNSQILDGGSTAGEKSKDASSDSSEDEEAAQSSIAVPSKAPLECFKEDEDGGPMDASSDSTLDEEAAQSSTAVPSDEECLKEDEGGGSMDVESSDLSEDSEDDGEDDQMNGVESLEESPRGKLDAEEVQAMDVVEPENQPSDSMQVDVDDPPAVGDASGKLADASEDSMKAAFEPRRSSRVYPLKNKPNFKVKPFRKFSTVKRKPPTSRPDDIHFEAGFKTSIFPTFTKCYTGGC
jgi:hypothetical protein